MNMEKEEWDSIRDTIMSIKKKREETKRKRDSSWAENLLIEEFV